MNWQFACNKAEIPEGGMKEMRIGEIPVLLLRAEGEVFAIPPLCPHMEEPLVNGMCDGTTLICIKHLWQWDLRDGSPAGDAEIGLLKYPLQEDADGGIQIMVETELRYEYQK
ncbi:Rieske (2Fe-2S) protein [Acidiphilium iwatense]|uniref:Rieske 2Fe-2S domain-containing protein n=1 Tax=Acidiphilium iwatense TaxID=768198 RepID=A0ABS9E173_9PROT|nr:Rieske 2Fe-2S domain-containing protein [Acidiphilium iwatense]MCF3948750.1 Rieske 2Fe-2S domain-containing protein [Acidiphilium iwatense]